MNNSKITRSRRFKYSSASVIFSALFIAVIIIVNAIFGALATKYSWYVDMTGENVFTLSDEAKEYISDVTSELGIYFAAEPDQLMADSSMRYIYTTALQLERDFPNINVECHDVVRNPAFFEPFYNTKGTDITASSVVLTSGSESTVYKSDAFFTFNDDGKMWAYNGEYRFISGIMQLTQSETPIVYFTTGHGEDIDRASTIANLFYDCGFDVRNIDLSQETPDGDARIIVIFNPKYDFIGYESEMDGANEISKIDDFLDGLNGLIVFEDPEYAGGLPNLAEFLEEWGISFTSGTHVKDSAHSMSVDGLSVVAQYGDDETLGASFYSELKNFDSMPRSVINNSMPIEILWESGSSMSGSRTVSPMLKSYDTAELIDNSTGKSIGNGEYNLVTMSLESRIIDNDRYYAYVMAAGSPSFAGNNYLVKSNSYGNRDIIFSAMKLIGRDRILADLPIRVFDDTTSTATTAQSTSLTAELTVIAPALIAISGIVIIVRRRRS